MRLLVHVSVDEGRPIEGIRKLCREPFRLEKALTECVRTARSEGPSWSSIGEALGSSEQAAWRRFARGPMAVRFLDVAELPRP